MHPEQIFPTMISALTYYPELPFADSMIIAASHLYPKQLYDYAAATNVLGKRIKTINDPLVHAVTRMTSSGGSGQLYFPFLDNIIKGKTTLSEIDAVRNDSVQY